MASAYLVLLTIVIFATVAILFWLSFRSRASKRAANMARSMASQVFPVWAAQGPSASGKASALAMRCAYIVVMGPKQAEEMADAITKHAAVYDRDPAGWEETRQYAAQARTPETADFIAKLRSLLAPPKSKIQQEIQTLSAKRQEETLAFAKSMITSIEANQLGLGAIELLADMLSRPGRLVTGEREVIATLQCLLNNPDCLRPHFNSLESEWEYEKLAAEVVRGPEVEVRP